MAKVSIIYGSSTGNTEYVAQKVFRAFGGEAAEMHNITEPDIEQVFRNNRFFVCALSTWGAGDMQDDWDIYADRLKRIDFTGKKVGILGLGDQQNYPDTFADGMAVLSEIVRKNGGTVVGETSSDGYAFTASRAEQDGKFVGLVIDEDNQSDQTDSRIKDWVSALRKRFN